MADIDNFSNINEHDKTLKRSAGNQYKENELYIYETMRIIRSKYEFLAEPNLKEQLKEYYIMDINGRYGIEKIVEFKALLPKIKETIKQEYKQLSDEYEELVTIT
jgi:hypothetical protein